MPARVMYVVDHLKFGGAQTHLVQLLSRLDRRRFAPMVCALKAHGELRPAMAWRTLPMILGGGKTMDFLAPMRPVFRRMRRAERSHAALAATTSRLTAAALRKNPRLRRFTGTRARCRC